MSRGRGLTLAERSRVAGVGAAPSDGARHCWVSDPRHNEKLPGLLLRWQPTDTGWEALVIYALPEPDGLVQGWLQESALSPA